MRDAGDSNNSETAPATPENDTKPQNFWGKLKELAEDLTKKIEDETAKMQSHPVPGYDQDEPTLDSIEQKLRQGAATETKDKAEESPMDKGHGEIADAENKFGLITKPPSSE